MTGGVVYNSSGTGSLPSFTTTGYYSFQTAHNFGTGQSVVLNIPNDRRWHNWS